MRFEKGNKIGKGRVKGSTNIATTELKGMFKILLENNLIEMQESLDRIKTKNPAEYVKLILNIASFVIPKQLPSTTLEQLSPQTYSVSFDT